jgi:hypothetical protein
MRIAHLLPPHLLSGRPVRILVVGAGGTGSAVVMGLPYLDQAMRVWTFAEGRTIREDSDSSNGTIRRASTSCYRLPLRVTQIDCKRISVQSNVRRASRGNESICVCAALEKWMLEEPSRTCEQRNGNLDSRDREENVIASSTLRSYRLQP